MSYGVDTLQRGVEARAVVKVMKEASKPGELWRNDPLAGLERPYSSRRHTKALASAKVRSAMGAAIVA